MVEESRGPMTITDMTDQDLVNLRRTVRIWPSLKNAAFRIRAQALTHLSRPSFFSVPAASPR